MASGGVVGRGPAPVRTLVDCGESDRAPGPAPGPPSAAAPVPPPTPVEESSLAELAEGDTDALDEPTAALPEAPIAPPAPAAASAEPLLPSVEDHYRTLGLAPRAPREQVERAYRFCREMYGPGSLATYSLLQPPEIEAARTAVDTAYQVLSDPARRRAYDQSLGLLDPDGPIDPFMAAERPERITESYDLPQVVTGAALKRIREMRGISLRQIASASKVGVRYLEYIEGDRFAFLPAPVYLRGFLAEYARVVGLDGRHVIDSYLARVARKS
jgi:helix-turn-helix protein/DnaJ-like protein